MTWTAHCPSTSSGCAYFDTIGWDRIAGTSLVQDYILRKIKRKIEKVGAPPVMMGVKVSPIGVERIDVGSTVPTLSKWMLKELTNQAVFAAEAHLSYTGNFVLKFATEATLPGVIGVNKGKPVVVRVVLAAHIKKIEGTICLNVKKMPSNRIWWGFTKDPLLEIEVIPEIGPKQFKWSMVTSAIVKMIQNAVSSLVQSPSVCNASESMTDCFIPRLVCARLQLKESLVAPNMDDIAFMDTSDFEQRGGIYGDALKREGDESAWNTAAALAAAVTSANAEPSPAPVNTANPSIDGHGLAPGVPNLKLGDPKPEGHQLMVDTLTDSQQQADGLRQRNPSAGARSVSGSSATSGTGSHAKKKSWFSSTTSLPAALGGAGAASSSSSGVPPVPSLAASASLSSLSSNRSLGDQPAASIASSTTLVGSSVAGDDDARDKLRNILLADDGSRTIASSVGSRRRSASRSVSSDDGYSLEPPTSGSHTHILASEPLHRSPSASSNDTTSASMRGGRVPRTGVSNASAAADGNSADYARYLEESARAASGSSSAGNSPTKSKAFSSLLKGTAPSISSKPSLFRKKSDRSTTTATGATADVSSVFPAEDGPPPVPSLRTGSVRSASPVRSSDENPAAAPPPSTMSATAANVYASWKAKAQEKQPVINEGVANAKQQMARWGNTWKAYRKSGGAAIEPEGESAAAESSAGATMSANGNSNDYGTSAPSQPVASTSRPEQPAASNIRRVPPPSTVPVHPAFSMHSQPTAGANGQTDSPSAEAHFPLPAAAAAADGAAGHAKKESTSMKAYRPAAMMAVPGMTEARRFQMSSEQASSPPKPAVTTAALQSSPSGVQETTADRKGESAAAALSPRLPSRSRVPPPSAVQAESAIEEDQQDKSHDNVVDEAEVSLRRDDSGIGFRTHPS